MKVAHAFTVRVSSMNIETIGVWLIGWCLAGSSRMPFLCMGSMLDVFHWEGKVRDWTGRLNMLASRTQISPTWQEGSWRERVWSMALAYFWFSQQCRYCGKKKTVGSVYEVKRGRYEVYSLPSFVGVRAKNVPTASVISWNLPRRVVAGDMFGRGGGEPGMSNSWFH